MEYLYMVIKSLFKQKKRNFLMMIQLFFGFVSLLIGFYFLGDVLQHQIDVKRMTSLSTLQPVAMSPSPSTSDYDKLKEIYRNLKNHKDVAHIASFVTNEVSYSLFNNKKVQQMPNHVINTIYLDKEMLEITRLDLAKGSFDFWKENINPKNYIPVIISSNLEKDFPMGSTKEIPYFGWESADRSRTIKIKVVGVLKEDSPFWRGGSSSISEKLIRDNLIMIPKFEDMIDPQLSSHVLISLKKGADVSGFKQVIEDEFNKKELVCQVSTIGEQLDNYYLSNQVILWSSVIFSLIILILTSFGIIGVVLSSILQRKKEFGVRISLGASPRLIAFMMAGEIAFIYLLSFLASLLFMFIMLASFEKLPITINLFNVTSTLMVTFIFAIFASVVPFFRIYQMEPVQILKDGGAY